nr:DUF6544 family protein [Amycolatopsis marina]
MPFRATETIHAGRSYRVTAHARRGPLRAKIEDTYDAGRARSRVRVLGIIPVRSQDGADLVRSARGRLVVESTWLPSAYLPAYGTRWSAGDDGENITVPIDGEDIEAVLHLGAEGELVELRLLRWSNLTEDGRYGWVPFSAKVHAHRSFDGYTIPSDIRASWATGTEREFEFFHATVEHAQFRA